MKGARLVLVGAVCALTAASSVRAQPYIFAGGGASFPVGDFKDFAKTGWMAQAGVGVDIGKVRGLSIEAEGFYGSNKHDADVTGVVEGDKTNLIVGLGAVLYSFMPDKKASPYVLAGAGILAHQFKPETGNSETETKFAYSGAVGIVYNASERFHLWVEGRFIGTEDTKVIPVMAGFSISFGKGGM